VYLENTIDRVENAFPRKKEFVLYGGSELSARLDVARAVARRAERRFWKVAKGYNTDAKALQYMNRLADYLYIEARYADYKSSL
jgi:cob(I)alamin adenosyltransferase